MVHPAAGLLQDATGPAPLPRRAAKAQQVRYSLGVKGEACSTAPFDKAMNNLNTIGHRAVSIARADWGPQIRRAVHAALSVVAFVYVCGSIVGRCAYDLGRITREAIEERNDQLAVALVAFLGLQRATAPAIAVTGPPIIVSDEAMDELLAFIEADKAAPVAPVAAPEPARVIVQRQAPEPAAIAAPARYDGLHGLIHISDPMARAVRLVREGKSQRLASQLCGVSRSSLQRALKAG
jgi:hypothetical protein